MINLLNMENDSNFAKSLSLTLLLFYFIVTFIFSFYLFIKINPSPYLLLLSYFLALMFIFKYIQKGLFLVFLSSILVIGTSIIISLKFFDTSWDGISYHSDSIRALTEGWNPIYEYGHVIHNPDNTDLWVNYFPKVSWYIGTLFSQLFMNPNASKASHLILSFAAAAYTFGWLKKYKCPVAGCFISSALVLFNPVFLTQWASNYLDSLVYSLFLISLLSATSLTPTTDKKDYACFLLSIPLLASVKSSGVLFSFIIIFIASCSAWGFSKKQKMWITTIIMLTLASSVLGFSPYITNLIQGRNLLYPLAKADTIITNSLSGNHPFYPKEEKELIDIISYQSDKTSINRFNTFVQLMISITSVPTNKIEIDKLPTPKRVLMPEGYQIFATTDVRLAGWGPLFLEAFMVGIILLFFALSQSKMKALFLTLIIEIILFPASWWARYTPMVYYIPLLSASCILLQRHKMLNFLAYITLGILVINNSIIGYVYAKENWRLSSLINKVLLPFKGKEVEVCRDPRFNVDLYFSSVGARVIKVIFDKDRCTSWNNLLPHLKIDKIQDSFSAWRDIVPYLYVNESSSSITKNHHSDIIIRYPFNYFKGLERFYNFAAGEDGIVFLKDGWSLPEKEGVWSEDYKANLELLGLPLGLDVQLIIGMRGSIIEKNTPKQVDVYVNDMYVDRWTLESRFKFYNLCIPAEVVRLKDPAILSFRASNLPLFKWKLSSLFVKLSPLQE